MCVHRGQLSGRWGGVGAVAFGGDCGRAQGGFRAVLGRFRAFGAVRAVGSRGSCGRTRGEVREVRAVSSRGSCGRTRAGGIPPRRS